MTTMQFSQLLNSTTVNATCDEFTSQPVRSLHGNSGTRPTVHSHAMSEFRTGENFSHLKLTAEKMMQEQACVKSDLQILKTKFLNSEEHVRSLECNVQEVKNENAMLKVKHKEDMKLWKGLDSKFLATTTFFDHLTETLQLLESQVQEAEQSKSILEEKLAERVKFYEETKSHVDDVSGKNKVAQESIQKCEAIIAELKGTLQQVELKLSSEVVKSVTLASEKDELHQRLTKSMITNEEDKATFQTKNTEIQELSKDLATKAKEVADLQEVNLKLVQVKGELECHVKDLQVQMFVSVKDKENLEQKLETLSVTMKDLEKVNCVAAGNIENLLLEKVQLQNQAEEDSKAQQKIVNELKQQASENEISAEMISEQLKQKMEEIEKLFKLVAENEIEFGNLKDEVNQLRQECCEKDHLFSQISKREELLKGEIQEMRRQLTEAENSTKDIKRQFKQKLQAKQAELTSHLQDISQRNNQEMTDMRRKYEAETQEAAAKERLRGEAALEAVKQTSNLHVAKELEGANQRLESARTDHEILVKQIGQAYEDEKARLVTAHGAELQRKQEDLRVELEKRSTKVASALQLKLEQLQKSHQDGVEKLRQDHEKLLLELDTEISSLQKQMKILKEKQHEELSTKIQEFEAHRDESNKEHQIGIQRLRTSYTKDIDEWKLKASTLEGELTELRAIAAKVVLKKENETQAPKVTLAKTTTVYLQAQTRTSTAKDKESDWLNEQAVEHSRLIGDHIDELQPLTAVPTHQVDKELYEPFELLPPNPKMVEDSQKGNPKEVLTPPMAFLSQESKDILKMSQAQRDRKNRRNEVDLTSHDKSPKVFSIRTRQFQKKENQRPPDVVTLRSPFPKRRQVSGVRQNVVDLETQEEREFVIQEPAPKRRVLRREVHCSNTNVMTKIPKRRKAGGIVTRQDPTEDCRKSSKKVKFAVGKDTETGHGSPALCDLFDMGHLDPYYTGNDPFAFE